MPVLTIPSTDGLLLATGKPPAELEEELRFLLAVKLFDRRILTLDIAGRHLKRPSL